MTVFLVLLAIMAVVLFFLEWKCRGQLDDGYNSFIMSDIGVLPGARITGKSWRRARSPARPKADSCGACSAHRRT